MAPAQAAAGYVTYDAKTTRYELPAEQAVALADEESPACVLGGFQGMTAAMKAAPTVAEAFRHGRGIGWHEHDPDLFAGTERFFRPGYNAHLVSEWIPALHGVKEKLEKGATVADVGCGHGASTIIMAKAFPKSRFVGFDYRSRRSTRRTRGRAPPASATASASRSGPRRPIPAPTISSPASTACMTWAIRRRATPVRQSLKPDGAWLLVEPFAHDAVEGNLNPLGRLFFSVSTLVCTRASLSQEVGTPSAPRPARRACTTSPPEAGFTHFRRATETPFNLVFELRI